MYDSSRKNSDASYKQINQPKLTPENLKLRGNTQIAVRERFIIRQTDILAIKIYIKTDRQT